MPVVNKSSKKLYLFVDDKLIAETNKFYIANGTVAIEEVKIDADISLKNDNIEVWTFDRSEMCIFDDCVVYSFMSLKSNEKMIIRHLSLAYSIKITLASPSCDEEIKNLKEERGIANP